MSATDNYDHLIHKINLFIRKYYFDSFVRGLIFLGAGLFSAYVVIAVSEYFGNFNTIFRSLLFYFFILLNIFLVCWLILPPLLALLKIRKTLTHNQAAEIIGKHFIDVNDKLLNTLQLRKLANEDPMHRALIEASIDQKILVLNPVSFPAAINIKKNLIYIKWVVFPACVIFVIALAAPSVLTESTKRLIRHNEYFAPVAPFKFVLQNSALLALQGDNLKLGLKLEGNNLPADVYIETGGNTFKLDKENPASFGYLFANLQQNTFFKFSANGFTSKQYEIKVSLRPALLHFDVALNYPAYLHKKSEILPNAGDLTIPEGTLIKWTLHTQNANGLLFNMNGLPVIVSAASPGLFEHEEKVFKSSAYTIAPLNTALKRSDPAGYRLNVAADALPGITVQEKQDSVSMNTIYFNGQIQDDHGFSSLTFHYTVGNPADKTNQKSFVLPVKADLSNTTSDFFYFWNLKGLGIKAGDQVSYFFEVADNDGVNGPKKVRSAEHTLHVPDVKELNNELNAGTEAIKQKMQSAIKVAGQIEQGAQKLNQLLLDKNTLSFDEKKQIEDLLQKRRELDELVKDIQDDNKKNLYNREENQQQDKALTEKQQQIEALLDHVLDPKTAEIMQKLQALLQQEQKEGTRDELSKMQMDNKSLKKELDRMLELYKKLEFQQKLNQQINQLNQLAQQQQNLADQSKRAAAGEQTEGLQKEQQKLNEGFKDVAKALDDLQKANEQAGRKQDFEAPHTDEQSIEQQMGQSSDALKNNSPAKASKSQQQAAGEMKQLAGKMQQNEQAGEEAENSVDARQLRELLKNLVNSSFEQEKVMETLKSTSPADPNYIILAQNQKNIKDNLKTAEDSLNALARRVPQIQTTVNTEISGINGHIDRALENLGDRRTAEATKNQQYAMTAMNNLALMLSEVLDQLQNQMSKGGKGKGKQMSVSQLAKMQQQLEQNMQKAREQMQQQGNEGKGQQGNNGNMSEQMAKLAREQQLIRETLQKINREDNKDGTGSLGNLDKIAKQMEQNEHDFVNRKITEESVKRQQQIQSRLLEAEKADQQREQDEKRESKAGIDMPPGYIKALKQYEQQKEKQTEQVKTIPVSLNLYYKNKIKSYFDILNTK